MSYAGVPLVASADIPPCRFIKITGNFSVAKGSSNAEVIGIAQQQGAAYNTPTVAFSSGQQVAFYGEGELAWLEVGSGGVTAGDDLISDGNGLGVTRATTGTTIQYVGAKALQTAAAGAIIPVVVTLMAIRPALS